MKRLGNILGWKPDGMGHALAVLVIVLIVFTLLSDVWLRLVCWLFRVPWVPWGRAALLATCFVGGWIIAELFPDPKTWKNG